MKNNKYNVLIPFNNFGDLLGSKRNYSSGGTIILNGYEVFVGQNINYLKKGFGEVKVNSYDLSFDELVDYQRLIDLSIVIERTIDVKGKTYIYYELIDNEEIYDYAKNRCLLNDVLLTKINKKKDEWSVGCDAIAFIPVEYRKHSFVEIKLEEKDSVSQQYLTWLKYREDNEKELYETSTKVKLHDHKELSDYNLDVKRLFLGKIKIKVLLDYPSNNPNDVNNTLGQPCFANLFITCDEKTSCGVLHLVILSMPFLPSHFMDNIISNALFVELQNGDWINLNDYIYHKFKIKKRGTAKSFITFFNNRKCLQDNYVASLLLSEIIYNKDENFGQIIDKDILDIVNNKSGMGQFDRAEVYAYSNSLIQFVKEPKWSLKSRLEDEVIECYYLELLCLEEASIFIAQNNLDSLLNNKMNKKQLFFLMQNIKIYKSFVNTMNYWNFKPVYPAAQKSLKMIRDAFQLDQKEENLSKNFAIINQYYSTLEKYNNYISTFIITLVARIITIIEIINKVDELHTESGWNVSAIRNIAILVLIFFLIPYFVKLMFGRFYGIDKSNNIIS